MVRVEKYTKKWGISRLGEVPHFIILVILFHANPLTHWIPLTTGYGKSLRALHYRLADKETMYIPCALATCGGIAFPII